MSREDAAYVVRQAMNHPMQGSCADGLKLALALLYERRRACPGAVPIIALHDEIVVECDEGDVNATAAWLEQAMVDGLAEVLAIGDSEDYRVPVDVEVKSGKTWGHGLLWSRPATAHAEEEERITDVYFEDESVSVKAYIDYRNLLVDSYPQIDACDECAEEYSDREKQHSARYVGRRTRLLGRNWRSRNEASATSNELGLDRNVSRPPRREARWCGRHPFNGALNVAEALAASNTGLPTHSSSQRLKPNLSHMPPREKRLAVLLGSEQHEGQ